MSRHRNVHNFDEDDYYDDYDQDEDDEYYYQVQSRLRKEKEANAKKKKALLVSKAKPTPPKPFQRKKQPSSSTSKTPVTGTSGGKKAAVVGSTVLSLKQPAAVVAPPGFSVSSTTKKSNSGVCRSTVHLSSGGGVMIPPNNFGGRPNATTTTTTTTTHDLPEMEGLNVDEAKKALTIKRKISPELQARLKAQKSRLSMVILGHVDAGKSTLMGQVLVQMGVVQKRVVTKYEKEASDIGKASFALAWIMDEDTSERERGVTIDVATKHISTSNHELTILDAPGHADYVPAMIAGAASADVGLLVVAATTGEFESGFGCVGKGLRSSSMDGDGAKVGQTREHVILSRNLGVSQLVVAVNKLDCADPPWSRTRFEEIRDRLLPFLLANRFKKKRVSFVPISGLTGINVKERSSVKDSSTGNNDLAGWYDGPTLLEAINNFQPAKRNIDNIDKPLRFIITDMYPEGRGVTTKGRMAQGLVSVGDKLVVLPVGDEATVTRVEHNSTSSFAALPTTNSTIATYDDDDDDDNNSSTIKQQTLSSNAERRKIALAGDSVDLFLTGIDVARIFPGNILSDVDTHLRPKIQKKLLAQIMVMDPLSIPIIPGMQVLYHMHSLDIPATVTKIISKENKKDGSQIMKPRTLTCGAKAFVELKLSLKVCIETYSDCQALGCFALRRGGDTVAVGIVKKVLGQV